MDVRGIVARGNTLTRRDFRSHVEGTEGSYPSLLGVRGAEISWALIKSVTAVLKAEIYRFRAQLLDIVVGLIFYGGSSRIADAGSLAFAGSDDATPT